MRTKLLFLVFLSFTIKIFSQNYFSQANAEKILKELVLQIGPRTMGSPAEQKALNYAKEKFRSFGCDRTYVQNFYSFRNINTQSGYAVGIKYGKTKRVIVIGGHIDTSAPEVPGANDNASGSAVVLELARVLSKRENQSTLVFVLFGGEEAGLAGSKIFLDNFEIDSKLNIDSIMFMLDVDMANGLGNIELDPNSAKYSAPKWLVKAAVEEYYNLGYQNLIYPVFAQTINTSLNRSASSDHEPFLDKGIPAIAFITDINTPFHTPQDNLDNYDPRGLKRSGEVVLKLIERFDSGIPSRSVEQYWFYLLGKTPVFLPIWVLKIFITLVLVFSIIAVLLKRKKRIIIHNTQIIENTNNIPIKIPGKFSWLKILFISFVPSLLSIFSFYLISWIKKINHPWYADPLPYFINAIIFFFLGIWLSLHISNKLSLTKCPIYFFFNSALALIVFTIGMGIFDSRLAIYPAISLLLITVAALIKNQYVKILLLILSPLPFLRLIFNEWFYFTLRMYVISSVEFPSRHLPLIVNGIFVIFFAIIFFPFFSAFSSGYRESNAIQKIVHWFKTRKVLTYLFSLAILSNLYLYIQPSYNKLWQRTVLVMQKFHFTSNKFTLTLRSPEYLTGIKLKISGIDTLLNVLEKQVEILQLDSLPNEIRKFKIFTEKHLSTTTDQNKESQPPVTNFLTSILSHNRPYKIDVQVKGKKDLIDRIETYTYEPRRYVHNSRILNNDSISTMNIKFYSFPEVPMKLFYQCFKNLTDTLWQEVKVTYNFPIFPIKLSAENTNFIFRTELIKEEKF